MAVHPVTHPSADALRAFALGKLNDNTAAALMNHLDGCPACCKQVAALSGEDFLNRLRQARSHGSIPPSKAPAASTPRSLSTLPPGQSSTSAPAEALVNASCASKPSASATAVPNLPPELAANPQYEILRELGRGGMGVVYLAKNKLMDRLEVLKVVNKTLLDHPAAVERFLREIRAAAKLSHANVVTAHAAVQQGELLTFAMEYVDGQDLASLVKTQGPLPVPHACYYVQQAASGLQHAFEKGMVHRDIKPQNLILAREGKRHIVKVLDFGLAKATREKKEDTGLTGEGKMLGTPDYIAPEQTLDAAKADIRADIYSLGCTLYYLLSGRPPFSASSLGAILVAHQMHEARPLNLERPEVPEELAAVVRKMMAKTPAKRYQTPLEVVQALNPFVKPGATPKASPELSSGTAGPNPVVKMARSVGPLPAPSVEVPKPQPEPAALWESLTEDTAASVLARKSVTIRNARAATVRERTSQKRWLLGGGATVGFLLLALGMWAGGLIVKTKDGTIALENLPAEAVVLEPIGKKPNDNSEQGSREKQLKELLVTGSVWKGKYNNVDGLVYLYVQHGNGAAFKAVHVLHGFEDGELTWFARNVRGTVKGNRLDYQPEGSTFYRVSGMWKSGCLEITTHRDDGTESIAMLKLEPTGPASTSWVLSAFHQNDTEGWITLNDDGTKGAATRPIMIGYSREVGIKNDDFYWLVAFPIPNGKEWGWHAPSKYHGDHSGIFGRCLIYSVCCGQTRDTPQTDRYVVLRGSRMTLFVDGSTQELPEPDCKWKVYCLRLDSSAGWKHPGGRRATDEDIKKVLADVTDLRIKGEYGVKCGGCLGAVEFGADDPFQNR